MIPTIKTLLRAYYLSGAEGHEDSLSLKAVCVLTHMYAHACICIYINAYANVCYLDI